jgi:ABC-type multidrug transport system fused ATPase/permease subunit
MKIIIDTCQLLSIKERRRAVGLLFMTTLSVFLETFSIGLIIPALTLMTQSSSSGKYAALMAYLPEAARNSSAETLVVWGMIFLIALFATKTIYAVGLSWVQASFTYSAQLRVSRRLMESYLNQPYSFHLQRNSAQLLHNATTGLEQFASAILHALALFTESLVVGSVFLMLLIIEPVGTLATAVVFGLAGGFIFRRTRQRLSAWGRYHHEQEGMRLRHLQQGIGGIKEVLLLGRASEFVARYDAHSRASARVAKYHIVLQNVPRYALEALAVTALGCLVFIMIWQGRELSAVVATLGLFATAAFRLIPSANRILSSLQSLGYYGTAVSTLANEIRQPESAEMPMKASGKISGMWNRIEVKDVGFRYNGGGGDALSDMNLVVERGEAIGLIGASGSGKSTAIDILLGLLDPTAGSVTLDGSDIRIDIRGWQKQIGYVPQTIYLADESLRQNIAFGIPPREIDDVAIERALKAAQLYEFARQLPQFTETEVGERGVRLSGGQRQRIGIARALYHDPQVLVLDEATSALDTETEEDVMQAIRALHGEKTIILVAHRMSTVSLCDRLYRLSNGRIIAQGKPSDILSTNEI